METRDKSPPHLFQAGLVIMLCVMLSASFASAVTIDDFKTGAFSIGNGAAGTVNSTDAGTGMIGGERETTLRWIAGGNPALHSNSAVVASGVGVLAWDNGDAIEGDLVLVYDGVGSPGLGSVDLTDGGTATQFLIGYQDGDGNPVKITIEVTDSDSSDAAFDTFTTVNGGSGVLAINFSDFTGIDFTQVDKLEYTFYTPDPDGLGGDHNFTFLKSGVIPEPVTMVGVFCGLLSLGGYIRKRKLA